MVVAAGLVPAGLPDTIPTRPVAERVVVVNSLDVQLVAFLGLFGNGTADHPDAGLPIGNGYSYGSVAGDCAAVCNGGNGGRLRGNGGAGFNGGDGGNAGLFGSGATAETGPSRSMTPTGARV